jgi:hypothetical protein
MQRFFLLLIAAAGLVSCSSSSSTAETDLEPTGGGEVNIKKNNPFAFKNEDVERGDSDSITGGKRSQYDARKQSAYAKANGTLPAYLQKSYQKKAWAGGKDYSTGSYQTGSYGDAGKKSRFGGRKSNESNQIANASGQNFSTGSYRTGSANESGRGIQKKSSAYTESRNKNGWGRTPTILSEGEYRSISMGQAKSLLGR